jgi:hypothetical protein
MSESESGNSGEGGFLGRAAKPVETGTDVAYRANQVGDFVGGVGTAISGAQAYSHIAPLGGTMFDAFTNGSEALSGGESVLGTAGHALGPVGQALGAATAVGDGM